MRAPPECQNARGAEVPGAQNWQLSEEENHTNTPLHTSNQGVSRDIEIVLDWWTDWRSRCERYQLAAEVIGLSDEKREELEHEGDSLARIMLAIGATS
jgi:hypothetical protein